ncbi:MAG: TIM-barrel domain-containing protein [Alkalispirochaeta sp.]
MHNAEEHVLEVSFLEEWLCRVTFRPDGVPRLDRTWMVGGGTAEAAASIPREGRLRDDFSTFSCPAVDSSIDEESAAAGIGPIRVRVSRIDGAITWYDGEGNRFAADLPGRAYTFDASGTAVFHYMQRVTGEAYYGFGERAGPLNKRGVRMRMHNLDALGYSAVNGDPLYKHWPIYITFNPDTGIAYALIYDNLSDTVFDMGKEIDAYHGDYRYYHAADGDVDYYLVYGPSIRDVVQRISVLIGRIPRPPRWTLGYLGSGMGYTDSPDAAVRLDDFVDECRRNEIPCDMFHLSSGYSMSDDGKRYVFVWNRNRVPDPHSVAATFHTAEMKVAANIKPCLLIDHPEYEEAAAAGVFLGDEGGPHLADFWGGKGSYIDFTSAKGYQWWKDRVRSRILEYGIDATWNDNNEYEIWDDEVVCDGFGRPVRISQIRPLHSLLMTRASWESQQEYTPDLRPFVLTRSGCPGIQRYAQTWSGDNSTGWDTLKYNIPMGLGFSITGQPNTGHDVGGFWGEVPSPELLVRWVQNGIFHPRFSIHSWRLDGSATEPWMYPEVIDIIRDMIRLRYRLVPYLYSLYVQAERTGEPIIRPLVYEFPDDPGVVDESFEFLLGRGLMVASVFSEGARERRVYLPAGTRWCDLYSGDWMDGGRTVTVPAPLERPTVLAREGMILPLGPPMDRIRSSEDDRREFWLFPGDGDAENHFDLYEDDGASLRYLQGEESVVRVSMTTRAGGINLSVTVLTDGYPLPYREVTVVLPVGEHRPVTSAGAELLEPDRDGRRRYTVPLRYGKNSTMENTE